IILVVPVEGGWDLLFEYLAVDRVDGRLYGLRSDIEGALRDCAEHRPVADGIKLSLSGVEADYFDVIITELLDSLDDADGRTLVRAVDGIDVLVRLEDRLGGIRRFRLIAVCVLLGVDFDIRFVLLH